MKKNWKNEEKIKKLNIRDHLFTHMYHQPQHPIQTNPAHRQHTERTASEHIRKIHKLPTKMSSPIYWLFDILNENLCFISNYIFFYVFHVVCVFFSFHLSHRWVVSCMEENSVRVVNRDVDEFAAECWCCGLVGILQFSEFALPCPATVPPVQHHRNWTEHQPIQFAIMSNLIFYANSESNGIAFTIG